MEKEIIYELSRILSSHWDEIIKKFNEHLNENFSKLYFKSFREYSLTMKTQDKTPLISGIFNGIMCIVLEDYGFIRHETDGYDFIYKTIKIEGKNTTSLSDSWTGNGFHKTNWHLLIKLSLDDDGLIKESFCTFLPLDESYSYWTAKTEKCNYSSLSINKNDYDKAIVVRGEFVEKTKYLGILLG